MVLKIVCPLKAKHYLHHVHYPPVSSLLYMKSKLGLNLEHTNTCGSQLFVLFGIKSMKNDYKNDIYLQLPH